MPLYGRFRGFFVFCVCVRLAAPPPLCGLVSVKKSADRRRRILISRLLIIRASVPRRKSPFPAYFKGFPAVSPLIPPYPAFLKYPVSPHFTRGTTEQDNTTEVAFYDMRTNMDSFGKTRQLRKSDFDEFVAGYEDPSKRTGERWSKFTREEIAKNPDDSLDLGLIRDDSIVDYDDLPDPVESGEEAIANLEEAVDLLKSVVRELRALTEEK